MEYRLRIKKMLKKISLIYANCNKKRSFRILTNPLTLAGIAVITLSLFGISGSSIGMYSAYFDESGSELVSGSPRAIRSDEWLVNSQMLVAQKEANYPYVNKTIGEGQNMSLVIDVPYKEWSVLFKPQNFVFFVLPFDMAFAFKWWFVLFVLFSGIYLLTKKILGGRKLVSTLLAITFTLSPFIHWWLTPGIVLALGYSFLILYLLLKIRETTDKKKLLFTGILSYTLACFALILYPPFQIPCMLVIATLYTSWFIGDGQKHGRWRSLLYALAAGIAALVVVGVFFVTRIDDVKAMLQTSYPGARVIESGGIGPTRVFSDIIQPLLQDTSHSPAYTNNLSESSNFAIPLFAVISISVAILVSSYMRTKKIQIEILLLLALLAVFLARMMLPFGDGFYKLLLLGSVPNIRLLIGVGLTAFLLLVYCIRYLYKNKFIHKILPYAIGINLVVYAYLLFAAIIRFPGFISTPLLPALLLLYIVSFMWLLLKKNVILAMLLLTLFSVLSTIWIHPLYRNTSILIENSLSRFIQSETKTNPHLYWAIDNNVILENIAILNGAPSLSGTYVIPQNKLFEKIAPDADRNITNRYAHVTFNFNVATDTPATITLNQPDHFTVNIHPCDKALKQLKLGYVISNNEINANCTVRVYKHDQSESGLLKTFIYKIVK